MKFVIAIEPGNETTAWGVVVPGLSGCFSAGESLAHAIEQAREAIDAHCAWMAREGDPMPVVRGLAELKREAGESAFEWHDVEVDVERHFRPDSDVQASAGPTRSAKLADLRTYTVLELLSSGRRFVDDYDDEAAVDHYLELHPGSSREQVEADLKHQKASLRGDDHLPLRFER